jgi:predicted DNA-binding protein (UPF0251 family)
MGVVSYDVSASDRRLSATFPLHTEEGVKAFLEQIYSLEELKFSTGDFDVVIWLADFYDTIATVGLSRAEHKVIYFVYFEGYKQKELVYMLGLRKNTINTLLKRGMKKIAAHYEKIRRLEEVENESTNR